MSKGTAAEDLLADLEISGGSYKRDTSHVHPDPDPTIAKLVPSGDDPFNWAHYECADPENKFKYLDIEIGPVPNRAVGYFVGIWADNDKAELCGYYQGTGYKRISLQSRHRFMGRIHVTISAGLGPYIVSKPKPRSGEKEPGIKFMTVEEAATVLRLIFRV